jgi:hypothetical protein
VNAIMTSTGRPYILVDVDGVLNPFPYDPVTGRDICPPGFTEHTMTVRGRSYQVRLNPGHGTALLNLAAATGAELAWATTWGQEANQLIAPVLGLPQLPAAPTWAATGPDKADGVVPWTAGRPFVWFEDFPAEREAAARLAGGVPHLVVTVDEATGLTTAHLREAACWLAARWRQPDTPV